MGRIGAQRHSVQGADSGEPEKQVMAASAGGVTRRRFGEVGLSSHRTSFPAPAVKYQIMPEFADPTGIRRRNEMAAKALVISNGP